MKVLIATFSSVFLWSAIFRIVRLLETQEENLFRGTNVKDVIFHKGLLFQDTARSLVGCARKCSSFKCCLTFTFNKVNSARSCRGHSTWNLTLVDNHTHSPGSRLFAIKDKMTPGRLPHSCAEIQQRGGRCGVRQLSVTQDLSVTAYCDDDWTVFQRRQDGSVDFYRIWKDYRNGFGDPAGEFWLGLEPLSHMADIVSGKNFELRVDLGDWEGNTAYALYTNFSVYFEILKYRLSPAVLFVEGNAGDSLRDHFNTPFSTKDADNDYSANASCAVQYRGAWWFTSCHHSHLNGPYYHSNRSPGKGQGVFWVDWKNDMNYTLKFAQMKFRPA